MLGVTLTPTMAHASDKINVIPSRASLKVDCRVPPGLGEDAGPQPHRRRCSAKMPKALEIEFTETVIGQRLAARHAADDARSTGGCRRTIRCPAVPVILPGFSDSRWFREAFPGCSAYGFFPHRHMTLLDAGPLVHNANERIDVRDLGFAAQFYADIAREFLG